MRAGVTVASARVDCASVRASRSAWLWVAVLCAWSALGDTGVVRHRGLAGPLAVLGVLRVDLFERSFGLDIAASGLRVLCGVLLGSCAGVMLGLWLGGRPERRAALEPKLDFARTIPPLLIFSLFVLFLGYGEAARVLTIALVAALLVSMQLSAAMAAVSAERLRLLRALGAGWLARVRFVYLYELTPACLLALRQAVCAGLVVTVVTEMLVGAVYGLGTRALDAQIAYDAPRLYAVMLVTGALGHGVASALLRLEQRLKSLWG